MVRGMNRPCLCYAPHVARPSVLASGETTQFKVLHLYIDTSLYEFQTLIRILFKTQKKRKYVNF